jgi:RNA polymerase sigma factor (sigma-70 family)
VATRITDLRAGEGGYAALEDRLLVLDFQAGNPEAFVEIHRRYAGLARRVCRRLLPNDQDAEEAFQETWIRAFQGLYRFNGRYALQPWIARIARNASLDLLRSRARRPVSDEQAFEEHEREDPAAGPEEALDRLLQRDLVLAVLTEMPEVHRRALVLRELEGLGHREIAEELGITPKQAKALIHRAKGSFRRRWLQRAAERGLAGVAFAPLALASRLAGGARRVAERLSHTFGAAEAVAGGQAASAGAAVSLTAERIAAAAAVTALVAGSVGLGLVAGRSHHRPEPVRAEGAVQAPAPAPVLEERVSHPTPPGRQQGRDRAPDRGGSVVVAPAPSAAPSPSPSPEPSPSPSAEPSPSPEPTVPPPPAWTATFDSSVSSEASCVDCPVEPWLISSSVDGTAGETLSFAQVLELAATDAEGDAAWKAYLEVAGEVVGAADGAEGRAELGFRLLTEAGWYRYQAVAVLSTVATSEAEGTVFTFVGPYHLEEEPEAEETVPRRGTLTLEVRVWSDGVTLTASAVHLEEL